MPACDGGALDAGLVGITGTGALSLASIGTPVCRRLTSTGAAAVVVCRRLTPNGATAGEGLIPTIDANGRTTLPSMAKMDKAIFGYLELAFGRLGFWRS
jgi:hypothetical protein